MLFATSIGGHIFFVFILAATFLGWLFKTIGSIDDEGEVKKTANEGIERLIDRFTK